MCGQGLQFGLKVEVGENQNNKYMIGQFERTLLFSFFEVSCIKHLLSLTTFNIN